MQQHMEPEGVMAGAVAIATVLTLLIGLPPQVHRKISAVTRSGQARRASVAPCHPRARRHVLLHEAVMGWIDFGAVAWWAVAVAFLVSFVFGWFWYSRQDFFPLWRRPLATGPGERERGVGRFLHDEQ